MATIRPARLEDAGAVLELLAELGRPAVADDPSAQRAVLAAHLAHGHGAVLVAEEDGLVVGCASLWFRPRLNWTSPEAWLPDLVVTASHRRRGIARALVDACAEEARRRGCHALKLESGHDRADAHALYAALGFDDFGRAYRLGL